MSNEFAEATLEVGAVNTAAALVAINTAKWGAYIGEPGNVITIVVSGFAIIFTVVRTAHYYLLIKDRNSKKRNGQDTERD